MRNVYDCVEAFGKLLDKEYHLVLGRKNISVSLQINFDRKECFHLMGLQYLTDRPELAHDRGKIFDGIKERRITAEQLQSSDMYYKIAERIDMHPLLEVMNDSNDTIFKYNRKQNAYSVIKADYIMKNHAEGRNIFLFLAKNREEGKYFCRSFFSQDKMDYTRNARKVEQIDDYVNRTKELGLAKDFKDAPQIVNKPACGSGVNLIALANVMKEKGIDYQRNVYFVAQDIDPLIAKMCYIQMSLLGMPGIVMVGDTLVSHMKQCHDVRGKRLLKFKLF